MWEKYLFSIKEKIEDDLFLVYVYRYIHCLTCMSVHHMHVLLWRPEKRAIFPGARITDNVSCRVGDKIESRSSERAACSLNYWVIFPDPVRAVSLVLNDNTGLLATLFGLQILNIRISFFIHSFIHSQNIFPSPSSSQSLPPCFLPIFVFILFHFFKLKIYL